MAVDLDTEHPLGSPEVQRHIDQSIATFSILRASADNLSAEGRKWFVGSLLVVNGGGCLACLNQARGTFMLAPACLYLFGIISSIMYGAGVSAANETISERLHKRIFRLSTDRSLKSFTEKAETSTVYDNVATVAGIFGIIAFLVGSIILGLQLNTQSAERERLCRPIALAMLKPTSSTRKDLPQIYEALGCKS